MNNISVSNDCNNNWKIVSCTVSKDNFLNELSNTELEYCIKKKLKEHGIKLKGGGSYQINIEDISCTIKTSKVI